MSTKNIAHHKIIGLLVFICGAILASLFIFHAKQKIPMQKAQDGVSIFSVARDLKPFELMSGDRQPLTQNQLHGQYTLLVFGFTHCSTVCPLTLQMLGKQYTELKKITPNLQVVLISLDPDRDSLTKLSAYVKQFNPYFIGASAKVAELRKLQSQFGVYSQQEMTSAKNEYQIQHTSSIFLINPAGKWVGMFKYGMKPEQFLKAYRDSIQTLATLA